MFFTHQIVHITKEEGTMSQSKSSGLEGVVVADTVLSDVDGERGRLIVAGHDIEQLTGRATFEDLCLLLWRGAEGADSGASGTGALPDRADREGLREALGQARAHAFSLLGGLGDALQRQDGMDALRAAAAHLE